MWKRGDCKHYDKKIYGSMVTLRFQCTSGHDVKWESQSKIENTDQPLGNVALTTATIVSGNTYETLKEIAEPMNLKIMSKQTYCRIQRQHVRPVVSDTYATLQQQTKEDVSSHGPAVLIGDGR